MEDKKEPEPVADPPEEATPKSDDTKVKQSDAPMDIDPQVDNSKPLQRTENGKVVTVDSGSGDSQLADTPESSNQSEEKKQKLDDSEGTSSEAKTESVGDATPKETVTFKVIYNKTKYDVTFDLDGTVTALKEHIQTVTGVPTAMQKLMYKGLVKDDKTLRELKVTNNAKFMLVGSKLDDVLQVNKPVDKKALQEEEKKGAAKEPFCKMKQHKKVLDKGVPDDAMPGIKGVKERLPSMPISGMVNKANSKVRLTFKLELDQLWIGTKERTEKLPMNSIKNVVSEPIEGHEEYHLMAIQLGPTEASRYWIYWVPTQYVSAIKDTILGKWPFF